MARKLTTPYPASLRDGVTCNDPHLLLTDESPAKESSDRSWDGEEDGEYIEVIRSKPNLNDTRRHLTMNPVPNFSSSFQATRTAYRAVPPLPRRRPIPKTPAPLRVDEMLRSSLRHIDNLVERTGSPIVIRYKNAILILCILAVTWQLAVLMDHLAQAVRVYCGA